MDLSQSINDAISDFKEARAHLITLSVLQAFNGFVPSYSEISRRLYVMSENGLEPLTRPQPNLTELFVAVTEMPPIQDMYIEPYLMKIDESHTQFFNEDHRLELNFVDPDLGYRGVREVLYYFYRVSREGNGPEEYVFNEKQYYNPNGVLMRNE